jgi:voltage-gated potassium channel
MGAATGGRGERPRAWAVGWATPPLLNTVVKRRRLSWAQALALVAMVDLLVVVTGAVLVQRTDPGRFPDIATGVWWAVTTVTTVGYGDVVPVSESGRIVAGLLMLVGIASFAFLTAVAASAIVVGEVAEEERKIEQEESLILAQLRELNDRVGRLEAALHSDLAQRGDRPGEQAR